MTLTGAGTAGKAHLRIEVAKLEPAGADGPALSLIGAGGKEQS